MELTINLPESTFQRLAQLAELTHQPLAELVLQSITGNLPPTIDNTPADIQADLLAMQSLSADDLRKIAQSQIDPAQQERHLAWIIHEG